MNGMPVPLILTEPQLMAHFRTTEEILSAVVDVSVKVQIDVNWNLSPIVGGLLGEGCEYVTRNRGLRVPVAPLLHLQRGLWAWLGYREEWANERPGGRMRRFSFRTIGITIHFGWKNDVFKPQMFRAEWAGWARWGDVNYCFQAADAGHPHWQFDTLESLPALETVERARELREILNGAHGSQMHEFSPQLAEDEVRDAVSVQKISRLHFASAAAWWKSAPHNEHAHSPVRVTDIESWVRCSMDYVNAELGRLQTD